MPQSLEGCVVERRETAVIQRAEKSNVRQAIDALKAGHVIALPTDTVYGLACDAGSAQAVNKIYNIKGREERKPLAICVGDIQDINRFAFTDHLPPDLLESLLPGPVTVVLTKDNSVVGSICSPGSESIGIRVPACDFIRDVCRGMERGLALTSANHSGSPNSICISDFKCLWEHCAFVYDGGTLLTDAKGSTVLDLTSPGHYSIIRSGSAVDDITSILQRHSLVGKTAVHLT